MTAQPEGIEAPLSLEDFISCLRVVVLRMKESAKAGLDHTTTYDRDLMLRLNEEMVGAVGEFVVGRRLGVPWGHVNTFHASPDAGPVEVRATAHSAGSLILRPRELSQAGFEDRVFVLVAGPFTRLRIAGWLFGRDARQPEFLRDVRDFGKPAYFVPQSKLHPLSWLERDADLCRRLGIGLPEAHSA